jgi:NAD(P)-dependent dehydrogenase (short-subunit alcohol dehydrogenase family)
MEAQKGNETGLTPNVILITGGSSGLGAEFVTQLSQGSDFIYFTYSHPAAAFPKAEQVSALHCDQRQEGSVVACVSSILQEHGRIDVLINNACPSFLPCDFLDTDWSMFQNLLDVNVRGSYWFMREAAKVMKQQGGGRIINILSSYVINVPPEKLSFYVTAKYALEGLSKAAAAELGKYGITVNMISPGLMKTQLTDYLPERYLEAYSQKHPMKRMTTTQDVAAVLQFLSSDSARFLNGVNIPVNGGETF